MMYRKESSAILWGNNFRAYMYGSEIQYKKDGSIRFYNALIPAGTEIQIWNSIQNYQSHRSQPALPLLKKGSRYQLKAQMTATPLNSVFLKIVFLDRYNEEISQVIEKSNRAEFIYPIEAYSYKVALLSAGVKQLDFRFFVIEEVRDGNG